MILTVVCNTDRVLQKDVTNMQTDVRNINSKLMLQT